MATVAERPRPPPSRPAPPSAAAAGGARPAPPAGRAGLPVTVDRRVQPLLRLPDGGQPVLLLHPVRHPQRPRLGRPRQLPVHVHRRRPVLAGGAQHHLDHRLPGPAPGRLRHRGGHRADQGQAGPVGLPDDLLPAHHGPAGRGRRRLGVPAQPGRARQPHPRLPAPARAPVVLRPGLDQAGAAAARPVDGRADHDPVPGRAPRRAHAALRGGRARGAGPGSGSGTSPCR